MDYLWNYLKDRLFICRVFNMLWLVNFPVYKYIKVISLFGYDILLLCALLKYRKVKNM